MHEFCRKRWWCAVVVWGIFEFLVLNASASQQAVAQASAASTKSAQQRAWAIRWVGTASAVAATEALRIKPEQMPSAQPEPPSQVSVPQIAKAVSEPQDAAVTPEPCALLLRRMPGLTLTQCKAVGLTPSGAVSRGGGPLYWRDVRPAQLWGRPMQPLKIMVVGAIHGDELTSATLAMRWALMAEKDPHLVHWRFIPVLNPDGLLANPPSRVNANGVDLNRNFPTPEWEKDAPVYWEKRTRKDPRRWPGPATLSEPESDFLHSQMQSFKPHLVLSLHAPYGLLDFDGPHEPPTRMGRLRLDRLGVFPGSLGHYGSVNEDMPVVTVELDHALDMPNDAEVQHMWRDLMRWVDTRLPQPLEAPHIELMRTTQTLYAQLQTVWQPIWQPLRQRWEAEWSQALKQVKTEAIPAVTVAGEAAKKATAADEKVPDKSEKPVTPPLAPASPPVNNAKPAKAPTSSQATPPSASKHAAPQYKLKP
jgi:protein MpaA